VEPLCSSAGHGAQDWGQGMKFTYSPKRLALKLTFQEDIKTTRRLADQRTMEWSFQLNPNFSLSYITFADKAPEKHARL